MLKNRALIIFPRFENGEVINEIREKYDPQYRYIELHDKLYSGILKPFYNQYIPYKPHITVGRLHDKQQHREVIESLSEFNTEFRAVINKIVIECIDDSEQSIMEFEYVL